MEPRRLQDSAMMQAPRDQVDSTADDVHVKRALAGTGPPRSDARTTIGDH